MESIESHTGLSVSTRSGFNSSRTAFNLLSSDFGTQYLQGDGNLISQYKAYERYYNTTQ